MQKEIICLLIIFFFFYNEACAEKIGNEELLEIIKQPKHTSIGSYIKDKKEEQTDRITNEKLLKIINQPKSGDTPSGKKAEGEGYLVEKDAYGTHTYKLVRAHGGVNQQQPIAPGQKIYFLWAAVNKASVLHGFGWKKNAVYIYETTYTYMGRKEDYLEIHYCATVTKKKSMFTEQKEKQKKKIDIIQVPLKRKKYAILEAKGQTDSRVYHAMDKQLYITLVNINRITVSEKEEEPRVEVKMEKF